MLWVLQCYSELWRVPECSRVDPEFADVSSITMASRIPILSKYASSASTSPGAFANLSYHSTNCQQMMRSPHGSRNWMRWSCFRMWWSSSGASCQCSGHASRLGDQGHQRQTQAPRVPAIAMLSIPPHLRMWWFVKYLLTLPYPYAMERRPSAGR